MSDTLSETLAESDLTADMAAPATAEPAAERPASLATPAPSARVGAMPDTRDLNFYAADHYLRFQVARRLPAHERAQGEALLDELGAILGARVEDLAAEADRQTPTLRSHTRRGERVDEIVPSRAYRELEAILYGRFGLAAMTLRDGVAGLEGRGSLVLNDALVYLAAQVESGLFCPLSMTRALARTLVKFAPPAIVARYLPRLTATEMADLMSGAMFMTEKQGGSDLGLVTTRARPAPDEPAAPGEPGWWRLDGEKWFCSNAGADLILTLARPEGAPEGTRGLGLFLVPRLLPDGRRNPYRIERLKEKLGMRSFASGEVTFTGTLAYQIGGPGVGWRQMTEMLNITRLGCACAAAALARRSALEAVTHARGRVAFGRALADLPLMRLQLLDLLQDAEALAALFFEGSAQLQAADAGDAAARARARVLTPLAKYHASDAARQVVAEGMEVRGGNAYIEEWPNARLLRDVHVQAIWEGTGNISALDVLRAVARDGSGGALLGDLRARVLASTDDAVLPAAKLADRALTAVGDHLSDLLARDGGERDLLTRRFVRDLAHAVTAALLVEDAAIQAAAGGGYRCLLQAARYLRRYVYPPRLSHPYAADYAAVDAFDALVDWRPALPESAAAPLLRALEAEAGGTN